jgi:hypothetical protein
MLVSDGRRGRAGRAGTEPARAKYSTACNAACHNTSPSATEKRSAGCCGSAGWLSAFTAEEESVYRASAGRGHASHASRKRGCAKCSVRGCSGWGRTLQQAAEFVIRYTASGTSVRDIRGDSIGRRSGGKWLIAWHGYEFGCSGICGGRQFGAEFFARERRRYRQRNRRDNIGRGRAWGTRIWRSNARRDI